MAKLDKELYPLRLTDKPSPTVIQKAIDNNLFRADKYLTADYVDHGILNIPIKNIEFYRDAKGRIVQPFREGIKLWEGYLDVELPNMFEYSFDYDKPIGVLIVKEKVLDKDGNLDVQKSKFIVIVGTHRTQFYSRIKLKSMAYKVIEADEYNINIIGLNSNITIPDGKTGKPASTVSLVSQMVTQGKLKDNKTDILKYINKIMPGVSKATKTSVLNDILISAKVELQVTSLTYSAIKIRHLQYPTAFKDYTLDMEYNPKTGKFGTLFTKSYADNKFFDAIQKYASHGIGTTASLYVNDKAMIEGNPWKSRAQIYFEYQLAMQDYDKVLDFARMNPNLKAKDILDIPKKGSIYAQICNHESFEEETETQMLDLDHPLFVKEYTKLVRAHNRKLRNKKLSVAKSNRKQKGVNRKLNTALSMNLERFSK